MADITFGTILAALKAILEAVRGLAGYLPVQSLIQVVNLDTKVAAIETINTDIDSMEDDLNTLQESRWKKVHGLEINNGFDGIIKRSRQATAYVDGLGDEYDPQVEMLRRIVKLMSPIGKKKPKKPDQKTISRSKRDFNTITRHARKFYTIINKIPAYSPVDVKIQKATYLSLIQEIETHTSDIDEMFSDLKPLQKQRKALYHSKTTGIRKIITETKKFVRGSYGENSPEYNSIKHIKI